MIRQLVARIRAWWNAPLPDVDSHPTLSRLDLLDGRHDIHWNG